MPRKTTKTPANPVPNAKDLELAELKAQLQKVQNDLSKKCLELGRAQGELEQEKSKVKQLEEELIENKAVHEKRDQAVYFRITKTAKEFITDYAKENNYKSIAAVLSDFVCRVPLKPEEFVRFMKGL